MTLRRACVFGAFASVWLTAPYRAAAQAAAKVRRVGVFAADSKHAQGVGWDEFVAELVRRGFVEGRNLWFIKRIGQWDRPELVRGLADELVELGVDVIYALSAASVLKRATSTIPIVFFESGDPVRDGLVASLSHPGGNLTGNSVMTYDIAPKALAYFAEAVGKPRRIAYIQPLGVRAAPWFAGFAATMGAAASSVGAGLEFFEVASVAEIEPLLKRLRRERFDAVIVWSHPMFMAQLSHIAALCAEHQLPAYGDAHAGFLLHYGTPYLHMARTAASFVARILNGAKPAELPVEQVSRVELVINMKTANTLGLTIPRVLRLRADDVIE